MDKTIENDDSEEFDYEDMSEEESRKAGEEWDALCKANDAFIAQFGEQATECFKDLVDGCYVTDEIKFVDKPKGSRQDEEFGPFKDVHVWQVCHWEDDYSGQIYARINNRWIEVPFHC